MKNQIHITVRVLVALALNLVLGATSVAQTNNMYVAGKQGFLPEGYKEDSIRVHYDEVRLTSPIHADILDFVAQQMGMKDRNEFLDGASWITLEDNEMVATYATKNLSTGEIVPITREAYEKDDKNLGKTKTASSDERIFGYEIPEGVAVEIPGHLNESGDTLFLLHPSVVGVLSHCEQIGGVNRNAVYREEKGETAGNEPAGRPEFRTETGLTQPQGGGVLVVEVGSYQQSQPFPYIMQPPMFMGGGFGCNFGCGRSNCNGGCQNQPPIINYPPAEDDDCEIKGCTNPIACNYNANAECDDGSCKYPVPCNDPSACNYVSGICMDGICTYPGCTNPIALNYSPNAGCDDGSCMFNEGCTSPTACNYDSGAVVDDGSCEYETCTGCTDSSACNYEVGATINDGSCEYTSCVGCTDATACNYDPTATMDNGSCTYPGCTNPIASNYNSTAGCDDGSCVINGCVDANACNYNADANTDDGSCTYPGCLDPIACNYNVTAGCDDGSCEYPGCTDANACNYDPNAGCDDGSCTQPGCLDVEATNYNPNAGCDDGSCVYSGCMDAQACNFNPNAGEDDGSCTYPGCLDPIACNYNPDAGCEDSSCVYPGCTDAVACNYNANAGCSDDSCTYPGCMDELANNFDPNAGCDDGSCEYGGMQNPDLADAGSKSDDESAGEKATTFVTKPVANALGKDPNASKPAYPIVGADVTASVDLGKPNQQVLFQKPATQQQVVERPNVGNATNGKPATVNQSGNSPGVAVKGDNQKENPSRANNNSSSYEAKIVTYDYGYSPSSKQSDESSVRPVESKPSQARTKPNGSVSKVPSKAPSKAPSSKGKPATSAVKAKSGK